MFGKLRPRCVQASRLNFCKNSRYPRLRERKPMEMQIREDTRHFHFVCGRVLSAKPFAIINLRYLRAFQDFGVPFRSQTDM